MYNFQKWILRYSRKPFIALLFWFFCKFIFLINEIRDARFENSRRFEITFCSDLCNKLTASWWICALSSISDSLETSVNCFYCVILSFSVNSVTMLMGCHEVWRLTDFLQFLPKPLLHLTVYRYWWIIFTTSDRTCVSPNHLLPINLSWF